MALDLFRRRTVGTVGTPSPARHWTPEGTTVAQRYRNAGGAIVLVFTAPAASTGKRQHYGVACLGCTYRAASSPTNVVLDESAAGDLANQHAATCRAMQRPLPDRPGDDQAAVIIRRRLEANQPTVAPVYVTLTDFHPDRVDLQRTSAWIKAHLLTVAAATPALLHATAESNGGTRFTIRPRPDHT